MTRDGVALARQFLRGSSSAGRNGARNRHAALPFEHPARRASRSARPANRSREAPGAPGARSAAAARSPRPAARGEILVGQRAAAPAPGRRCRRARRPPASTRSLLRRVRERNRADLLDAGDAVGIRPAPPRPRGSGSALEEDVVPPVLELLGLHDLAGAAHGVDPRIVAAGDLPARVQHRHADRPVSGERVGDHGPVAGLEDVEREQRAGHQDDAREREEGDAAGTLKDAVKAPRRRRIRAAALAARVNAWT